MIKFQNIGIEFQGKWLFQNISWNIGDNDRIGLIGANGTGKTTLLRIVTGEIHSDEGTITKSKNLNIGYLPQENITLSGRTLYDETMSVFEDVNQLFEDKHSIEKKFSKFPSGSKEFKELIDTYGDIEEKINKMGGYTIENQAEKILTGLGFDKSDWHKSTKTFSGGWEMRIALGKLLLQNPDYLLLDEPTNFLDIESITWLENYLKNFQGGVILVSHDRYFMDRLVKRIAEIEVGKLTSYTTNYSGYLKAKEKQRELILKAYKKQQDEIERVESFIKKFRANASKAKLVKSKEKMLEKMELVTIPPSSKKVKFRFSPIPRSGDKVIELKGIEMKYDGKKVLENINLLIRRGERIAIVGVNGAGKTTLSRILTDVIKPTEGERKLGVNVQIGYFAQKTLEMLNPKNTILSEIERVSTNESESRLRTFLGAFLFSGNDVFKQVQVLSGGEKTRLAIAKILINPVNLLIMDEPTNHLDLTGKKVLEDMLKAYTGTIILITHDRAIIDSIADKVIEVDKGTLSIYFGNYTDYIERKITITEENNTLSNIGQAISRAKKLKKRKKGKKTINEISETENLIEKKEKRVVELEILFLDTKLYSDMEKVTALTLEHKNLKQEIKKLYKEWETSLKS